MKTLTCLVTIFIINQCFCDETVEISLKQGVVIGKVEKTILKNQDFYTFKGIPFAETPTGELRFQVRPSPWGIHKLFGVTEPVKTLKYLDDSLRFIVKAESKNGKALGFIQGKRI